MTKQSSEMPDQLAMTPVGRKPRTAVTRANLIEAVYRRVGLSRAESARLVALVLKETTDCLERGETVKLSAFGSFVVRNKGPRPGRNPKTGVPVPIPPRMAVIFKPSTTLRDRLQERTAGSDGWPQKRGMSPGKWMNARHASHSVIGTAGVVRKMELNEGIHVVRHGSQ
jgi:integration host factor subunit alpha